MIKGKSRLISRLENTGTMDSSTYTNLRSHTDQAVHYARAMFTGVWLGKGRTGHRSIKGIKWVFPRREIRIKERSIITT